MKIQIDEIVIILKVGIAMITPIKATIVITYTGFLETEYQPAVLSSSSCPEVFLKPRLYETIFAKNKPAVESTDPKIKRRSLVFFLLKSSAIKIKRGKENKEKRIQNNLICQLLLFGGGQN